MLARRMQMAASSSAVPPYLAGGAPMPIAVYDPMGAASLAASYVNVVNPGTFDAAPGVAPTWAAGTGWGLNGTTQYLTTGIVPGAGWAMLIRFSGAATTAVDRVIAGQFSSAVSSGFFVRQTSPVGAGDRRYRHQGIGIGGAAAASGVIAQANFTGYFNGAVDATIASGNPIPALEIYIGGYNLSGVLAAMFFGAIQYAIIWDTSTDHATWMPAVSAAVMSL